MRYLSTRLEVAVIVLLVGEAQSTALTKAGRVAGVTPHVGHQQQGRAETLPTLRTLQHPLMGPGVFLQLLGSLESLPTLQAPDLVPFGLLVAPAARVLLVPLEVLLTQELPETRHAVNALGFTLVFAVQPRQAVVAAAAHAGVRQQTEMGEAVFQEGVFTRKGLGAVRAFKMPLARRPPVAHQRSVRAVDAAAHLADDVDPTFLELHMVFTLGEGRENALAAVTLVKLFLQVSHGQVLPQMFPRCVFRQTYTAPEDLNFCLGVGAVAGVSAQVDPVAVNLGKALSAFGTRVRSCPGVQVHVILELELGRQLHVTDAAAVVA